MANKHYIVIGVVVLAVAAGTIFWSRDNSATSDASILEHGVKNLTRESAAKMIKAGLQLNQKTTLDDFRYDKQLGHYTISDYSADDVEEIKALAEAGYVTNIEEKPSEWSSSLAMDYISYDFTDKATPYFAKKSSQEKTYIVLGEVENVEVTGLTETAAENGQNTRTADFTATYKATPIGAIIDEKKATEPFKWKAKFVLYDDGWRIAQ